MVPFPTMDSGSPLRSGRNDDNENPVIQDFQTAAEAHLAAVHLEGTEVLLMGRTVSIWSRSAGISLVPGHR